MRRLVVISGKSKFIAIFAAMALSLTSIHLAAKAHIASLQREQEQLEKTTLSSQPSAVSTPQTATSSQPSPPSQISSLRSIEKNAPLPAKPSAAADEQRKLQPPSARSLSALQTGNWRSSTTARY